MSLAATLTIDLGAIVRNWRALDALSTPECETAAVVKADAYGCGAVPVGQALARAGVSTFFVAVPTEGAALRDAVGPGPAIYILGGYGRDQSALYRSADLRAVLNSAEQARSWFQDAMGRAAIQLDTGMNRLGMEANEFKSLGALPDTVDLVMSHLGNADDPPHPLNRTQLQAFQAMTDGLAIRRSLSATAGLLLGSDWHFDLTRMGIGLYGGWPYADAEPVIRIEAPVIQVRQVEQGETVGYGATWVADQPRQIATISAGYADGLIRALSGGASIFLGDRTAPLAGRVSMDLITLDVTGIDCAPGDMAELIGSKQSIDQVAAAAGTIGHEILTSLGARYMREYRSEA